MMQIDWLQKGFILFAFAFILTALAQIQNGFAEGIPPSPIAVDATVDKTSITVGDVVTFSIIVRSDTDIESSLPDFNEYFNGFDLIDNGSREPQDKNGQMESVYWYQLRADLPGTYTIPPVPLNFTVPDPQNSEKTIQGQTLTPEVILEIKSILHLQGEPTDIKDIKSILDISSGLLKYLPIFLLILAGLGLWLLRQRKPSSPSAAAGLTPISPPAHELALRELQELKAKGWIEQGQFRIYYFELSEIFRRYMGSRFSIPALDWTLEEITLKLKGQINIELWQQARSILEYSDLVKFAKSTPSFGDSIQTMDAAISFIQSTRPAEEVDPPPA